MGENAAMRVDIDLKGAIYTTNSNTFRRARTQATQLGYQYAASHSGTDDGDGMGNSSRRIL
jgi:hypothetical protein